MWAPEDKPWLFALTPHVLKWGWQEELYAFPNTVSQGFGKTKDPTSYPQPQAASSFSPWAESTPSLGEWAVLLGTRSSRYCQSPQWKNEQPRLGHKAVSAQRSIPASDPMALARLVLIRVPLSFKATTDPSQPEHGMGTKVAWVLGVDRAE